MAISAATQPNLPPSPKGHFLTGNMPEFRKDALGYASYLAREYGDLVYLRFAGRAVYHLSNPQYIHQILVGEPHKVQKAPLYKTLLSRFLGNGLVTSDGEFWRRQRKLSQPAFHHRRIQSYAATMVDYTERLRDQWEPGVVRDINKDMMRLTLNIVGKTLFNTNIDGDADTFAAALTMVLTSIAESERSLIQIIPDWFPTPRNRRRQAGIHALDQIIYKIIAEHHTSGDTGDLLSMLMLAEDEDGQKMTDQQLRDEAITLVSAGHETTATALAWTFYLLAQHPEVEAKLHAELDRVLVGRAPNFEDLRALEYTEMVIKEAMRLFPPVSTIGRTALQDLQLGPYTIPAGANVMISIWNVHHDPQTYPEPNAFQPERFTRENEKTLPKSAYMPFGGGPRVCIGNSFASMETVLLLATLAQRYQLRLEPGQDIKPEPTITLRPNRDILMRVEAREPAAQP